MPEDMGEKTEMPTSRRLSEARGRGQVARSQDLAAAIDLIGAFILIVVFGASLMNAMGGSMRRVLGMDGSLTTIDAGPIMLELTFRGALALAPALGIMLLVAALAHVLQVGPLFTTEPLAPSLSRMNPLAGLRRLVDTRNLTKTGVNTLKLSTVLLIGALYLRTHAGDLAVLPGMSALAGLMAIGRLAARLAVWLLALLLIVGVVDWLYQRWQ